MTHHDENMPLEDADVDGQDLSADIAAEGADPDRPGEGADVDGLDLSTDTATEGDDFDEDGGRD